MADLLEHLANAASSRQDEEKHLRRKERNRQSAAISRKRQQDHRTLLEDENVRLQEENAKLRRLLLEVAPHIELPVSGVKLSRSASDTAASDSDSSSTIAKGPCSEVRKLLPSFPNSEPEHIHEG